MKQVVFFALLITALSQKDYCWGTEPVISEIMSTEHLGINGIFEFQIKYKFLDTVTFSGYVNIELPDGWTATVNPALANNTFIPNPSLDSLFLMTVIRK